jgi:hypothetical protein
LGLSPVELHKHGERVALCDDLCLDDVADILAVHLHGHRSIAPELDPVEVMAGEHVTRPVAATNRLRG